MQDALISETDWQILLKMFPNNWKELAKSTKAMVRKFRNFENEERVMRALLVHIAGGYSLRETATRVKMSSIANVSDVALLKRLQCSENSFRELCLCLLKERGVSVVEGSDKVRMKLVDATNVKEPGKTGSLWRIHYSLILPDLECDYFKLTSTSGMGNGESFKQFPLQKRDCIIGDRGYSTAQGIAYVASRGAYSLVRVNTQALKFLKTNGEKLDLTEELKILKQDYETKEINVIINADETCIKGRLCIIRKSHTATDQAIKKLKRQACIKQKTLNEATIFFAKYVIIFTTLPHENYPLKIILAWYRFRWQIELVFKRLKSLAGLGHLPKHDEISARAWLYGKLFTGLLIEKLIHHAKSISPWGYL